MTLQFIAATQSLAHGSRPAADLVAEFDGSFTAELVQAFGPSLTGVVAHALAPGGIR